MRWEEGREVVEQLLAAAEIERVAPDGESAKRMLDSSRHHLSSADTVRDTDPEAAFAILYDAARKACAALLETQGLRATARGGHVAIREAVMAQFAGLTGGSVLRSFDRLRRRRHAIEYASMDLGLNAEEVGEALSRAREIVSLAQKLVESLPVF